MWFFHYKYVEMSKGTYLKQLVKLEGEYAAGNHGNEDE